MYKIDWSLLKRSLSEKLSQEEQEKLDRWVQSSEEREQYYHKMRHFFQDNDKEEVDVDGNWEKFLARHAISAPTPRRRIIPSFMKYAAVLVLAAGMALYYFSNRTEQQSQQLYAAASETPAAGGVVLYTGNGEKVIIDEDDDQQVVVADSLAVSKNHGRLDYADVNKKDVLIQEKHTLEVPRGAEYTMTLSDGTLVRMNSETTLRYPVQFNGNERVVKLTGEAYFEVAKNGKPFMVDLGDCMVKVLGTHFNVRAYSDEKEVQTTLLEGSVAVKGVHSTVLLKPGEQAVLSDASELTKRTVDVEPYISWIDGRYVFVDERLENVLNTIARWYDVTVFYEKQSAKDIRINGTLLRDSDVSVLLRQIEKSEVAHFKLNKNVIVVN